MSEEASISIRLLRSRALQNSWRGAIRAQVENLLKRESANGKPFWELKLRDATDSLTLRAWLDTPAFDDCEKQQPGNWVEVGGEFYQNGNFGLDAKRWRMTALAAEEAAAIVTGDEQTNQALAADFGDISSMAGGLKDPRLQALCEKFLSQYGERFQRAAAARNFHHARRGGLCAHTAQMMRSGDAICGVYKNLNRDLLLAGILFHDSGKLWETCPAELSLEIPINLTGEMLGHISIGIELVNRLWSELEEERKNWESLQPESEKVRLHLLHLIAAHHGELEFGSPVQPKTPEAMALHFIDNLDAKLEMLFAGYQTAAEVAPGIFDRVRPLNHNLITPLPQLETSTS